MLHSDLDFFRRFDVVLNLSSDDVFRSLSHTGAFMQCRVDLTMREDSRAAHYWTNRVCIQDSFSRSREEVRGFAALEVLIEVDQEREQRALLLLGRRVVIYVFIFLRNAARGPRAVDVCSILCSWDTVIVSGGVGIRGQGTY